MKIEHVVVAALAAAGTACATGKIVKELGLPAFATPVVSALVAGAVTKTAANIR